jgi:hypothetical protein
MFATLTDAAAPARLVLSCLPCANDHFEAFQRDFEAVLESLFLTSDLTPSTCVLPVEKLFGDTIIVHANYLTSPVHLAFLEKNVNRWKISSLQHFGIWYFVLSSYAEGSA